VLCSRFESTCRSDPAARSAHEVAAGCRAAGLVVRWVSPRAARGPQAARRRGHLVQDGRPARVPAHGWPWSRRHPARAAPVTACLGSRPTPGRATGVSTRWRLYELPRHRGTDWPSRSAGAVLRPDRRGYHEKSRKARPGFAVAIQSPPRAGGPPAARDPAGKPQQWNRLATSQARQMSGSSTGVKRDGP